MIHSARKTYGIYSGANAGISVFHSTLRALTYGVYAATTGTTQCYLSVLQGGSGHGTNPDTCVACFNAGGGNVCP